MVSLVTSGTERTFDPSRIIVSKTDLKGRITYVNRLFCDIADYDEAELIGKPHNMIRHAKMPRGVFELLWGRLKASREMFAYVVNMTKGGDYYWVWAHVTASFDANNNPIGYHSNRRVPRKEALDVIQPIYDQMMQIEARAATRKEGIKASTSYLEGLLQEKGVSYDEFIFSL